MKEYIKKKLINHYSMIISIAILIIAFLTVLFLYNNFYKAQLNIADIYILKGRLDNMSINTSEFDNIHEVIDKKTNRQQTPALNIESPF
ncbi:hypothetical protein COT95_02660 [Candidatus Falkowbacteria bacterium CG10_big_fil_rev_8_21_14_0_10_37_6]|uniref:Uncharacterized protein n=1 Tax=Candidatus Falkowbacteria bacterium CG10_big_fil_rev_8_21_14_0_10_37_6 TaxID=1974563 RepID=A0A2H0V8R7_9BACT|nr:MAG: hypothetical protein COT95_02660 [Candidatus Falkowbacteria bacterium CG10_big_fil_rev_8_21_14_0_10_37_6]